MFFILAVDLVAPCAGALVEIIPIGKLSSGQKVVFNEVEWPFHPPGPVGISDPVSVKLKAVAFGKGRHLRYRDHVWSRSAQYNDVRVIGHHAFAAASKVLQGFRQKHFAIETLECRIALEKQHMRIT